MIKCDGTQYQTGLRKGSCQDAANQISIDDGKRRFGWNLKSGQDGDVRLPLRFISCAFDISFLIYVLFLPFAFFVLDVITIIVVRRGLFDFWNWNDESLIYFILMYVPADGLCTFDIVLEDFVDEATGSFAEISFAADDLVRRCIGPRGGTGGIAMNVGMSYSPLSKKKPTYQSF